jgi:uncharacterized membrane protein SpoIIM required for sporulation
MNATRHGSDWLSARAVIWRLLSQASDGLRRRQPSVDDAVAALDGYRSLARDLATVRQRLPGSRVAQSLESIYAQYHAAISRAPHNVRAAVVQLFRDEIPDVVASLRAPLVWVVLLFVLCFAAGWWLIASYPSLISLLASEDMIAHVERGELWTDGLLNVAPSSLLSIRILSNNIAVSVGAFCAGIFFGIGTAYMIGLNGLLLGGAFAFTQQYGLSGALLRFIAAHGPVELSVICLAGAAGVALGESLIRPDYPTRRESFERCTARLGKLLVLCAILLVGCGLIEGYVSPNPRIGLGPRVAIGLGYFAVMLAALSGRLFGRRRR